ncbi:MAG: sensor histidine kinase [Bacteroidota bacterium]|nr:sensor histidine kinase [Bacteroidota bacterium]
MEELNNIVGGSILSISMYFGSSFFETFWPSIISLLIFLAFCISTYYFWVWRDRSRRIILDLMVREKTVELVDDKQKLWDSYLKIEAQNQEKKVLIQELHHRVKNNLQTISSLIGMQLMSIASEDGKKALQETSRRIMAVSQIHEILYSYDGLSHISSRNFFEVLASTSLKMYDQNPCKIEISADFIDIELEVSTCIPLGMIITEAISNCMKHAFGQIDSPIIRLNLSYADRLGWLAFSIKDNGCGIPDEFIKGKNGSMGMRLLNIFARQLEANFQIENSKGTAIMLEFKMNNHENSNW